MPDFPAPAARYALVFHDEFDGPSLDLDKWLPWHLPQWSSRERAAARAHLRDGCLVLEIAPDQRPWCPEFDGDVRVSSLQTGVSSGPDGSTAGQHRFNPAAVVREAQPPRFTFAPRHGWIEMRARLDAASPCHAALWMTGVEDEPTHSGEICICELFAEDAGEAASIVRFGVHPFGDPLLADDFRAARLAVPNGSSRPGESRIGAPSQRAATRVAGYACG